MRHGNFSKKYSSNLDDVTLPTWLVLSDTTNTTLNAATDSMGGIILKRTSTDGDKTLKVPLVTDALLSAVSLSVLMCGLSTGISGTLDLGFYASESDYLFLRFTALGTCSLMYCKDGTAKTVSPIYLQNTGYRVYRHLKLTYNFKEKLFEVRKNDGAVYLSLDNIDINKSTMQPMIRWNASPLAIQDRLFHIEVEKFYL